MKRMDFITDIGRCSGRYPDNTCDTEAMVLKLKSHKDLQVLLDHLRRPELTTFKIQPIGLVKAALRGKLDLEFCVDAWPRFTSLVIRADEDKHKNVPEVVRRQIVLYSQDPSTLIEILDQPGIFNWRKKWYLPGCPSNLEGPLTALARKHHGVFDMKKKIHGYLELSKGALSSLSAKTKNNDESIIPEGYKFEPLRSHQARMVAEKWIYPDAEHGEDYVRYLIEHYPSTCLYNELGQPVAWCLVQRDYTPGMVHVIKAYQGRNFSRLVTGYVSTILSQNGDEVFGYVPTDNIESMRLMAPVSERLKEQLTAMV